MLDQPQLDHTHQEFVDLLAHCDAALAGDNAALLPPWQALCIHTVEHFALEERWMADTGFAPDNCHAFQHKAVLQLMLECERRAREDADFDPLRVAVGELAIWFPQHAQMMDASLVYHLGQVGYDAATGQCARPPQVAVEGEAPTAALTGCGSSSCG